jgi:hypothetical protein
MCDVCRYPDKTKQRKTQLTPYECINVRTSASSWDGDIDDDDSSYFYNGKEADFGWPMDMDDEDGRTDAPGTKKRQHGDSAGQYSSNAKKSKPLSDTFVPCKFLSFRSSRS